MIYDIPISLISLELRECRSSANDVEYIYIQNHLSHEATWNGMLEAFAIAPQPFISALGDHRKAELGIYPLEPFAYHENHNSKCKLL